MKTPFASGTGEAKRVQNFVICQRLTLLERRKSERNEKCQLNDTLFRKLQKYYTPKLMPIRSTDPVYTIGLATDVYAGAYRSPPGLGSVLDDVALSWGQLILYVPKRTEININEII